MDKKMKKKEQNKKICMEFEKKHLQTLVTALEVYSRLRSGQISMALDEAYFDRNLSWDEREYLEKVVRTIAFPRNCERRYDGHGGFYDQYDNEYDENGNILKESEDWKAYKNRPHLDHANSSFGIGCDEMKDGTVAWEIKKAIQEYFHYERNDGYRDMGVDGDGVLNISGVPSPKVIDPETNEHWRPVKQFPLPKSYQEKMKVAMAKAIPNKAYSEVWSIVETAFKKKPLPRGSSYKVETDKDGKFCVAIEKPFINNLWSR